MVTSGRDDRLYADLLDRVPVNSGRDGEGAFPGPSADPVEPDPVSTGVGIKRWPRAFLYA